MPLENENERDDAFSFMNEYGSNLTVNQIGKKEFIEEEKQQDEVFAPNAGFMFDTGNEKVRKEDVEDQKLEMPVVVPMFEKETVTKEA